MMEIDEASRSDNTPSTAGSDGGSKRSSWASVSQHMTQMDLSQAPPAWRQAAPPHAAARPFTAPYVSAAGTDLPAPSGPLAVQELAAAAEPPSTPQRLKRQGWLGPGPTASYDAAGNTGTLRTSPAGSSSTSSGEQVRTPVTGSVPGYDLAVVYGSGDSEAHSSHAHDEAPKSGAHIPYTQAGQSSGMNRLDALVAVATQSSEAMRQ